MMRWKLLIYILIIGKTTSQLVSPCPKIFKYEPQGAENDRWYGTITLISESELTGVWIRLILDKQSLQLGNWFGDVVTTDHTEYLVKKPGFKLNANTPFSFRFFIRYDPAEAPPKLLMFRLNARTVCPENGVQTEPPATSGELITSSILSTTDSSLINNKPDGYNHIKPSGSDEDIFPGDFSVFTKRDPGSNTNSKMVTKYENVPCGTVVTPAQPLITHGQVTKEGEFPWHAALYHASADLTYVCGGSLISRYHLITVAHCVCKRRSQETINADTVLVYLGKYYLASWSSPNIQEKYVEKIIIHPKYNSHYGNDIAILKFTTPADFTDYVRPICLWSDDIDLRSVVNRDGTVVGWGFDQSGHLTNKLTKATMPIVTQETCIFSFPDYYSRFTTNYTFCAGYRNGTSVCNGDSGGGMAFLKTISTANKHVWQLRGLVSLSVPLQNLLCDSSHYVVFTDIAKYLDWIRISLN